MAFISPSSSLNVHIQCRPTLITTFNTAGLSLPKTRTRSLQLKRERTDLLNLLKRQKQYATVSLMDDDLSDEAIPISNTGSSPGSSPGPSTGPGTGTEKGAGTGTGIGIETGQPYQFEDASTRVIRLQRELDEAVAAEEYGNAAEIRDALREATSEDSVLILSALVGYYDAFSSQNVDRLRRQWHDRDGVICQHPLTSAQVGYQNIINGYRTLFSTLPADFSVSMSDVRIAAHGDVAYATCVELPYSESLQVDMREDGVTRNGIGGGKHAETKTKWHGLLATHIFEKVWDYRRQQFQYLLVHHSSSPIFKPNVPLV